MQEDNEIPESVSVIAWIWIGLGVLMLFGGFMNLLVFSMTRSLFDGGLLAANGVPVEIVSIISLFKYVIYIAMVQLPVSVIAITAGFHLLKLRKWARTAIELISWLVVVYLAGFSVYWIDFWPEILSHMPPNQFFSINDIPLLSDFGIGVGIILNSLFAIPLLIAIVKLRQPEVKKLFI